MKAIELKPTDLMAVVLPLEANRTYISGTNFVVYYDAKGYRNVAINEPLQGNWQILGTCTADHIDFDVEPYVQAVGDDDYKDYTHHINVYADENESFRSLLSSNGLTDYEKLLIIKPLK